MCVRMNRKATKKGRRGGATGLLTREAYAGAPWTTPDCLVRLMLTPEYEEYEQVQCIKSLLIDLVIE